MSMIAVNQLTKAFGEDAARVIVVEHASFEVAAGEVVLLLGPSGSGKTTLLSMIGGLLRPTSGEVHINGQSLHHLAGLDSGWRLRSIGFVFQSFNLLPALTATQNAVLPLRLTGTRKRVAERQAHKLLATLGLADHAHLTPRVLSGGEKQRVSIARALLTQPKVLLADEPTASLDSHQGHVAMELLTALARQGQQACLIVTHDRRLRSFADRVLYIEDGHLHSENQATT